MVSIETERLLLRLPRSEDLEDLCSIYANPNVMRFIGNGSTRTPAQVQSAVVWMLGEHQTYGYGLWTTVLKDNDNVIGRCGLIHNVIDGTPELEIAYMLDEPCWGRGLATEAAIAIRDKATTEFNQTRLIALIHELNTSSKRVAAKLGMQFEKMVSLNGIRAELHSLPGSVAV